MTPEDDRVHTPSESQDSGDDESELVRSAGSDTSYAPDEAVGSMESGNDPTNTRAWVRRRIPVVDGSGSQDAVAELLQLPGVARAGVERDAGEIVMDMQPDV